MADLLTRPLPALFLCLFAFLAVATAVGRRLARRPSADAATLVNLNERITSWWAMVAILAAAFLAGPLATILLFALVSFWCLREFTSLTPTPVADHYALAAAFYLFLPLQYVLLWDDWYGLFAIAIIWATCGIARFRRATTAGNGVTYGRAHCLPPGRRSG